MANNSFIPAGRTSLVGNGEVKLQVQTEYADRPYPRITTTILNCGQVLHKIEKKLDEPISCSEEQKRMQDIMTRQHTEIIAVIERRASESSTPKSAQFPAEAAATLKNRLEAIEGIHRVYQLNNKGSLINQDISVAFRLEQAAIFENLHKVAALFEQIPDSDGRRATGVRTIQPGRLYLVSSGECLFFVVIQTPVENIDYVSELKQALIA